jgi:hypothetical protein
MGGLGVYICDEEFQSICIFWEWVDEERDGSGVGYDFLSEDSVGG